MWSWTLAVSDVGLVSPVTSSFHVPACDNGAAATHRPSSSGVNVTRIGATLRGLCTSALSVNGKKLV